jgi:hypothetical protein
MQNKNHRIFNNKLLIFDILILTNDIDDDILPLIVIKGGLNVKEPIVSRVLKYAMYAVFAVGAIGTVTLPFTLDSYLSILRDGYSAQAGYRQFILIFLLCVAVPSLWITLEMIWMLRSIPRGPFMTRNVRALNRIGILFLALAAAFLGKCLPYFTILTLLCGFLFIGGGLFAFTLAALIRQAAVFREENDLTI